MKTVLDEISKLPEGQEKEFLLTSYHRMKKYIKNYDEQSLEILISRLNGIYNGMTSDGQKICNDLINKIMEAVGKT